MIARSEGSRSYGWRIGRSRAGPERAGCLLPKGALCRRLRNLKQSYRVAPRRIAGGFHLGKRRMPIEKKKNLLVPLNNPRRPTLWARIVIAILRPPLLVLGFVFGNLYELCFGWLDKRIARQNEQRFAEDVRTHLPRLFSEHGAKVIPNEGVQLRWSLRHRRRWEFALKVCAGAGRFLGQGCFCFWLRTTGKTFSWLLMA